MAARRWLSVAPAAAALVAAAIVVPVTLLAQSGPVNGPAPQDPIRPMPVPLDLGGQSLDRCATALEVAGLTSRFPNRAEWRPLALMFTGDVFVTLLDGAVPFVCVTGPRTVEVSDPRSAVPIDTATLLLATPGGVLAAVAPAQEMAGAGPSGVAGADYVLRVTGGPITDLGQLATAIEGSMGIRLTELPERLAEPALHLTDRPWISGDRPTSTVDHLHRCQAAQAVAEPAPRRWQTAHLLAYHRGEQPASLLVAISPGTVGGCSVAPDGVTPLRVWRIGTVSDGTRPFVWLPGIGEALPDLGADIAAGPVEPRVARMEVTAATRSWQASVVGGTFATQIPNGVTHDPRELTVRAFDAEDQVIYQGPAAG